MIRRVLVLAVLLVCVSVLALSQVRLLIIDRTETMEESLRLEALARSLTATRQFEIRAMATWPRERWEQEPFHLVLYLPREGTRAWLCAPGPSRYLPPGLQEAQVALVSAVEEAFQGKRLVTGMEQDLYPWLLAVYLSHLKYLVATTP